jgi:hypothetical protein
MYGDMQRNPGNPDLFLNKYRGVGEFQLYV